MTYVLQYFSQLLYGNFSLATNNVIILLVNFISSCFYNFNFINLGNLLGLKERRI